MKKSTLIFNELSLENQFNSKEHFIDNLNEMIEILKYLSDEGKLSLIKSPIIWEVSIFQNYNLGEILSDNCDEFILFKMYMDYLIDDPYIEPLENSRIFCLNNNIKLSNSSGIVYAVCNDFGILSFSTNEIFKCNILKIKENNIEHEVINNFKKLHLCKLLFEDKKISRKSYLSTLFEGTKLNIEFLDSKILDKLSDDDFNTYFLVFKRFSKQEWIDIKKSDSLKYKKHHDSSNISDEYRNETLFKFRCFGKEENGVFYVVDIDTTHKKSN